MKETTTIEIPLGLRRRLELKKRHPRQAYHEVISAALDALQKADHGPGGLDPLVAANREALLTSARANGIERLWLFGSRARGQARPGSDVDLLYEAREQVSLWEVAGFMTDAQEILGCRVDLADRRALRGTFRAAVAKEALPL
ncbi:MAG: nucleotidyltransferase family protein [Thermoplasmatota archaeon]